MVAELLHDLGYSLQANQKTLEGSEHPDRNAQFEHLNGAVQQQLLAATTSSAAVIPSAKPLVSSANSNNWVTK